MPVIDCAPPPPPRLKAQDIKYLAIEGGGGAGNALPGALRALADRRLLNGRGILQTHRLKPRNILGFSGASAGAITAMFLASGYTPGEIDIIQSRQPFEEFFDTPQYGLNPRLGGCRRTLSAVSEPMRDPVIRDALGLIVEMMSQPALLPIFARPKRLLRLARATRDAPSGNWLILLAVLLTVFGQQLPPRALQQLKSHKRHTVLSLVEEYGMFPGCVVREFFEKWLTIARARVSWAQSLSASDTPDTELQKQRPPAYWENEYRRGRLDIYKGTTFRQHEAVFGVKLAVTGTNLETYKCHLFSGSTTPCIPVADAIRISMSLPIAFKPIRIDSSDRRYTGGSSALEGLWIDGGLVNNIPLHAFDHEPGANPKTLGLRLGLDRRARIRTLQDYLKQWPLGILVGTGEAHISRTRGNSEQTINLDSMDLGLFEFSPSAARVRPIQEQARRDTLRYFGLGP